MTTLAAMLHDDCETTLTSNQVGFEPGSPSMSGLAYKPNDWHSLDDRECERARAALVHNEECHCSVRAIGSHVDRLQWDNETPWPRLQAVSQKVKEVQRAVTDTPTVSR